MMERLKQRDDLNIFECVNIFEFVSEMRTQRMKMVQTLVSRLLFNAYDCIVLFKFNTLYTPLTHSYILGLFTCIHTFATLLILQDQYVFIHDALCDYITCGDTSVPAHELKAAIATFMRVNKNTKMTGFQEQFDVRTISSIMLSCFGLGNSEYNDESVVVTDAGVTK